MKKFALLFVVISFCSLPALYAADQDSDTLVWNGRRYLVTVAWDCPSMVQIYYQRTATQPPFQSWSTTNGRGHVALFELLNEGIYLTRIEAKRYKTRMGNLWTETGIDTIVTPDYFDIQPLFSPQPQGSVPVLADWFSGVVELTFLPENKAQRKSDEAQGLRYLYIVRGMVKYNVLVTDSDRQRISKGGKLNDDLQLKKQVLDIQQRYRYFYVRSGQDREQVVLNGHEGLFAHKDNGLTLFMERLDNDPLRWHQNWEKSDFDYGAPFGSYLIRNDSIFITAVATHWGTEPFNYKSQEQFLPDAMADSVSPDGLLFQSARQLPDESYFADWFNGDYVINYGQWHEDEFGVREYDVVKTQKLRVHNGRILRSEFSPSPFDDDQVASTADVTPCHPNAVFSVEDEQLTAAVGKFKKPKKAPAYQGGKTPLRNYYLNHPLTDQRVKDRLFRVRIGFLVTCNGEVGQWQIINKSTGELYEMANIVLETAKTLPATWEPAEDKKGNKVDCWQILEFTVSNGILTNANYK